MMLKNLVLVFLFNALFGITCYAQDAGKHLSPEAEAFCNRISRTMASQINLNEAELIVLKSLNKQMILKTAEITDTYRNDTATREKKLKEITEFFNSQMKPVLKPYQLQAFVNLKVNPETWVVPADKATGSN